MRHIELNFTNCKYIMDVYDYVKREFDLPKYCGSNLSAIWDFLRDYCPQDAEVVINGIDYLNDKFDGFGEELRTIFERVPSDPGNENIRIKINS